MEMTAQLAYTSMVEQNMTENIVRLWRENLKAKLKGNNEERFATLQSLYESAFQEYKALHCELSDSRMENEQEGMFQLPENTEVQLQTLKHEQQQEKITSESESDVLLAAVQTDESEAQTKNTEHKIVQLQTKRERINEEKMALEKKVRMSILKLKKMDEENREVNNLKEDVALLTTQNTNLREKIKHVQSEAQNMVRQRAAFQNEKEMLFKEKKVQEDIKDGLVNELKIEKNKLAEAESLTWSYDQMEKDKQTLRKGIKYLKDQIAELSKDVEQAREFNNAKMEERLQLENACEALAGLRAELGDKLRGLQLELQQLDSIRHCFFDKSLECARLKRENQNIQDQISSMIKKVAKERLNEQKLRKLQMIEKPLKTQKKELEEYLMKVTAEYDAIKSDSDKFQETVNKLETLTECNIQLQKKIADTKTEIRKRKVTRDVYERTIQSSVNNEAENAKLCKEVEKLEKNLMKYEDATDKYEQIVHGVDDLRKENLYLHEQIHILNEEITSKKVLIVDANTLAVRKKQLLQRNVSLMKEIEKLQKKDLKQINLRVKLAEMDCDINDLYKQNQELYGQYEELFVQEYSRELIPNLLTAKERLEKAVRTENTELKNEVNRKCEISPKHPVSSISST